MMGRTRRLSLFEPARRCLAMSEPETRSPFRFASLNVDAVGIVLALLALAFWGLALGDGLGLPEAYQFDFTAAALSTLAVLATWQASKVLAWFLAGLQSGQFAWAKWIRLRLGMDKGEQMHEASWIAVMLHITLWAALPLVVLSFWGLSDTSLSLASRFAWTGFGIGDKIRIVPGQVMLGILLFAALVIFTRWLAGRLEHKWLLRTPLEAYTRETVATLFGYVTFVLAGLAGLAYAGFDLSNLAIIAGALSLGIGFGLQQIVNNFVSGLILLFERPIRTGDYITVSGTEGYVRRVRIRSTEIETLDRMTVVVPNSELLTHHVQNWNLRDHYGRITNTVGVAYGSDIDLVKQLLLQVADEHPLVVSKGEANVPGPTVFFQSFGDNSLNFDLKVFIRQIAQRFVVRSDLNFAIDRVFREHDITIAFPQRDVWFRNGIPGAPLPADAPAAADQETSSTST